MNQFQNQHFMLVCDAVAAPRGVFKPAVRWRQNSAKAGGAKLRVTHQRTVETQPLLRLYWFNWFDVSIQNSMKERPIFADNKHATSKPALLFQLFSLVIQNPHLSANVL